MIKKVSVLCGQVGLAAAVLHHQSNLTRSKLAHACVVAQRLGAHEEQQQAVQQHDEQQQRQRQQQDAQQAALAALTTHFQAGLQVS